MRRAAQPSLSVEQSPVYQNLVQRDGPDQLFEFGHDNVSRLVNEVLAPYLPLLGPALAQGADMQLPITFMTQVLSRMGSVSSVTAPADDLAVSYISVKMQ